jgi:hypothetical protein
MMKEFRTHRIETGVERRLNKWAADHGTYRSLNDMLDALLKEAGF